MCTQIVKIRYLCGKDFGTNIWLVCKQAITNRSELEFRSNSIVFTHFQDVYFFNANELFRKEMLTRYIETAQKGK